MIKTLLSSQYQARTQPAGPEMRRCHAFHFALVGRAGRLWLVEMRRVLRGARGARSARLVFGDSIQVNEGLFR